MKTLVPLALLLIGIAALTFIFGVRILIVPPINAIPEGRTVIIANVHKLRMIDSPDGYCQRQYDYTLWCRARVLGSIGDSGTIMLRLPYSEALYNFTLPRTY